MPPTHKCASRHSLAHKVLLSFPYSLICLFIICPFLLLFRLPDTLHETADLRQVLFRRNLVTTKGLYRTLSVARTVADGGVPVAHNIPQWPLLQSSMQAGSLVTSAYAALARPGTMGRQPPPFTTCRQSMPRRAVTVVQAASRKGRPHRVAGKCGFSLRSAICTNIPVRAACWSV